MVKDTHERLVAKNEFYKFELKLAKASAAKLIEELKKYPGDCNERRLTKDILTGIERGIKSLEAKIVKYM